MQSAEDGVSHNTSRLWQRLWLARDALLDALVRSCVIEVGDVFLDDALEMVFAEDEEVVEALPAQTPQESFADGVSLWRPHFEYAESRCVFHQRPAQTMPQGKFQDGCAFRPGPG